MSLIIRPQVRTADEVCHEFEKLRRFFLNPPAGSGQAVVTPGNVNGAIAALTFSNPPTQAECEALRDACEVVADDMRAVSAQVNAIRAALVASGLIKGGA